ncbi:MAG: PAS domain S-box protein [Ginsengibacter sp.]
MNTTEEEIAARLSAIGESADDAIITNKLDGTITSWNQAAEKIFGYTAPEAINKNISIIVPKEFYSENERIISQVRNGERIKHYETIRTTKDNNKIDMALSVSPIKDNNGDIMGISIIATDISEQKLANEKQAVLSAIVNSSDDAIISKTLEGIITSWNPAASKMFGYTESEALGKHISIIIPPERLQEESMIIENVSKGIKVDHFATVRVAKNKRKINISLTVSPIRDKDGNIIGASKIARDISDQKLAEEKQATLAAIVSSSDDAIVSKTLFGIITSWNHSAFKMFGYTEAEVLGKHISIIIPPDRMDEETMIIENIRNGKKINHFETVRIAKDGRKLNISLTVSPIRNKAGKIIGASKIARDITEKIQTEKQRLLYTEKLKQLNKYKDEFMAMASHELKTPLTIIKANLDILVLKMQKDDNSQFVEKTLKQVEKLDKLINDLLDISKIQAGKLELKLADFDMNVLLKEMIHNIQPTTPIKILLNEYSGSNLLAYGDMDRIGLVIVNLLGNAIKYAPGSEEIKVEAFKSDDAIIVSIQDKGIGIPQEELTNIFSRFYRVSGLTSTFAGSGIGLYISSQIISRHGGKIWAVSELNKGSTFYFSIPASVQNL